MMNTRISAILLSGAIGLTLSGCAATSPTMRAQSPGYGPGMHSWDGGYVIEGTPVSCPPQKRRGKVRKQRSCNNGQCGTDCLNVPFHPVHRNFHTYDVPQGLTYPQDNTPAASYQYPYYTFRGPTDFFMK